MRKRLILLLTIFITSFAQQATSAQRLKFMGKSMDCSMSEMATHLQTKGCKIVEKKKDFIFMEGTFQGYKNCHFNLVEDYNILEYCSVVFSCYYMASANVYSDIVKRLTQKYGVPSESGNSSSSYCSEFTGGKCSDFNSFFIEGGAIKVIRVTECFGGDRVWIIYEDSIAKDKIEKIKQEEL